MKLKEVPGGLYGAEVKRMAKLIEITGKAVSGEWGSDDLDGTGIPVLRTTNFTNTGKVNYNNVVTRQIKKKNLSEKMLQYGDIILEKSGGSDKQPVGRVIFFEGEENKYLFNNFTGLLRVKNKDKWIPRYVFYALFANYYAGRTIHYENKTTGLHNLQTDSYVALTDIPDCMLSTQQKIVSKLDKISDLIEKRRQQLDAFDQLVKARFVELMQTYPSNNLLEKFISAYKAERCGDRDLPVLSITKEDGIAFQSEKFKKRIASVDASTYKVVPRGKLVQGIHIDERNFAIQNIADEGIVSPAYKIWNVNEDNAIPEVLAYAMRTDRTMAYISSKFTGSVKRRESISMNDFMATPIDLPSIKVQTEFYNFMKQTDKSKLVIQKSLNELETLKKALMQEYFG